MKMKVKSSEKYEYSFWAIACPNPDCGEQIELDSKGENKVVCPFCNTEIEIEDD